jgi:hypothetical protein
LPGDVEEHRANGRPRDTVKPDNEQRGARATAVGGCWDVEDELIAVALLGDVIKGNLETSCHPPASLGRRARACR